MIDRTPHERYMVRRAMLLTKGGKLTQVERAWLRYLEAKLAETLPRAA